MEYVRRVLEIVPELEQAISFHAIRQICGKYFQANHPDKNPNSNDEELKNVTAFYNAFKFSDSDEKTTILHALNEDADDDTWMFDATIDETDYFTFDEYLHNTWRARFANTAHPCPNSMEDPRCCRHTNKDFSYCLPFECDRNKAEINPELCYCMRDGMWLNVCKDFECVINPVAREINTTPPERNAARLEDNLAYIGGASSTPMRPFTTESRPWVTSSKGAYYISSDSEDEIPCASHQRTPVKKMRRVRRIDSMENWSMDDENPPEDILPEEIDEEPASQGRSPVKVKVDVILPKDLKKHLATGTGYKYKKNIEFVIVVPTNKGDYFRDFHSLLNYVGPCFRFFEDPNDDFCYIACKCTNETRVSSLLKDLQEIVCKSVEPMCYPFKKRGMQALYSMCVDSAMHAYHVDQKIERDKPFIRSDENQCEAIFSPSADPSKFHPGLLYDYVVENDTRSEDELLFNYRKMLNTPVPLSSGACDCGCKQTAEYHKAHKVNAEWFAQLGDVKKALKNAIWQYATIVRYSAKMVPLIEVFQRNFDLIMAKHRDFGPTSVLLEEDSKVILQEQLATAFLCFDQIFLPDGHRPITDNDILTDPDRFMLAYSDKFASFQRREKLREFLSLIFSCVCWPIFRRRAVVFRGGFETGKTTLARILKDLFEGGVCNIPGEGQAYFNMGQAAGERFLVLDDVSKEGLLFIDRNFRNVFDGFSYQFPVKHCNSKDIQFPPFILTTNYDLPAGLKCRSQEVHFKKKLEIEGALDYPEVKRAFCAYIAFSFYNDSMNNADDKQMTPFKRIFRDTAV